MLSWELKLHCAKLELIAGPHQQEASYQIDLGPGEVLRLDLP